MLDHMGVLKENPEGNCDALDEELHRTDARISETSLGRILDAIDEPAFIVSTQGCVLFANSTARLAGGQPPTWLAQLASAKEPEAHFGGLGRVCRLELEGRTIYVVFPKPATSNDEADRRMKQFLGELPPSLATVAELLLRGMSDREIAEHSHLTYRTVRTYVTRLFRRVGVTSREELMAKTFLGTERTEKQERS
jgi:hypothetical protein